MESLNNPNFLDNQYPNLIDTKKFGHAALCPPMATAGTDSDADIAIRCRVVTLLYGGGNSLRFAEDVLKVGYTGWNHAELTGKLSRNMARTLTQKFPEISLDWLYRGRDVGLSITRAEELATAFRKVDAEMRTKKPRDQEPKRKRRAG